MSDLLRVLLVEDNPGDADLIVELCRETDPHYPKSSAWPGFRRLSIVSAKGRFDIILLDLGLSDSDGLARLRSLQRQAHRFAHNRADRKSATSG